MKVLFVVGPTGSGKTEFALRVAEESGAHILNADSVQFYQGLDIGSAKPSSLERARVPHHLFDVAPVGSVLTAGDYRRLALEKLAELESVNRLTLVVGGSGFYIQALEKGMFDFGKVPMEISAQVKADAESRLPLLAQELADIDPDYAKKVGPTDKYRIARAIELWRHFRKTPSELRAEFKPQSFPYPLQKVGLSVDREVLRQRVEARAQSMLQQGWIEEVQVLLREAGPHWPPLQSVGYAEILKYLAGDIPWENLVPEIVTSTMRLAKRQATWFRRDSEIVWYDIGAGFDGPLEDLRGRIHP